MFYVHLFLRAMYRKINSISKKKKSAKTHAWQFVLKPQKAIASYVKQASKCSKGTFAEINHCDCNQDKEINWQHVN